MFPLQRHPGFGSRLDLALKYYAKPPCNVGARRYFPSFDDELASKYESAARLKKLQFTDALGLSCFRSKQVPHEVDGFLLVNQVRQTYPNIDVTLTSTAAGADESEFRTIGKPWHLTVLLVRIQFGDM
jgi:hypothetical protein